MMMKKNTEAQKDGTQEDATAHAMNSALQKLKRLRFLKVNTICLTKEGKNNFVNMMKHQHWQCQWWTCQEGTNQEAEALLSNAITSKARSCVQNVQMKQQQRRLKNSMHRNAFC